MTWGGREGEERKDGLSDVARSAPSLEVVAALCRIQVCLDAEQLRMVCTGLTVSSSFGKIVESLSLFTVNPYAGLCRITESTESSEAGLFV